MRKPSRAMPRRRSRPLIETGVHVLLALGALFSAMAWFEPKILLAIGAIAFATITLTLWDRRRLAQLATGRQGESICSFARSFDYRAVDTWVIRAVFEELQPYCKFGRRTLPLRATDDLDVDLRIDPEDFEYIVDEIAWRTGRSQEDCASNPLCGKVNTVADLVHFFVNQPLKDGP